MMSLSTSQWHERFSQQAIWTKQLRDYLFTRADLHSSRRVLDVGCGTGAIEVGFSRQFKLALHLLDINRNYLSLAKINSPGCFLVQGDGHSLPYASGSFDIVFCHYLLLWVAEAADVIAEMVRLTRRGGAVIALAEPDYGGRIDYPPPLDQLGHLQTQALHSQGADVNIGRKLGEIFSDAGLINIELGILGGQWLQPLSQGEIDSEWKVLQSDFENFEDPLLTKDNLEDIKLLDQIAWEKRERILFVPTFYALGQID